MSALATWVYGPEARLAVALLSGLAAAYGRELARGKRPSWRWWCSRLLLLPAAVIISSAAKDALSLSDDARTFLAMMTTLRGYRGLALPKKHIVLPSLRLFTTRRAQPQLAASTPPLSQRGL